MSTLEKYNQAFEMLGSDVWKQVPDIQRCALVGVAENSSEEMFEENSPAMAEIMPLFRRFGDKRVVDCLNEIRHLHRAQRENCPAREAVQESSWQIHDILSKLEKKVCG